jgi:putative transposase
MARKRRAARSRPRGPGRPSTVRSVRALIWDQHHLLRALREFEACYNHHRPHQGIANARPLRPLPPPITDPDQIAHLDIRRRQRLGGILNEYDHAA